LPFNDLSRGPDTVRRNYQYIEHTGDLGFKAYGRTREALFSHAAEAFFQAIISLETIQEKEKRLIEVEAAALDELMVGWLSELLFLFDTELLLLRRFEITDMKGRGIKAMVWGEVMDPARHEIKTGIKAVTYHQLYVKKRGGIWEAQVILDI
jgi:SHS2 domain-containing protein